MGHSSAELIIAGTANSRSICLNASWPACPHRRPRSPALCRLAPRRGSHGRRTGALRRAPCEPARSPPPLIAAPRRRRREGVHAGVGFAGTEDSNVYAGSNLRVESDGNLSRLILAVVKTEGPVHTDVVIDRLKVRYRLGRIRGSTRDHVVWRIGRLAAEGEVHDDGGFLYVKPDQLRRPPRRPVDRNIEHYPPSELRRVVIDVADSFLAARAGLIVEVARRLGFTRTGGRLTTTVNDVVDDLIASGDLEEGLGRDPSVPRLVPELGAPVEAPGQYRTGAGA